MEKNQLVELTIKDQSKDGIGIASCDGLIVFAEGCVVGDKVSARVTKVKSAMHSLRLRKSLNHQSTDLMMSVLT